MAGGIGAEFAELDVALKSIIDAHGDRYAVGAEEKSRQFVLWAGYLKANNVGNPASRLLDASLAGIKEVATCLTLGLVRPALFSLRTQLELSIGFPYFRDHSVEWEKFKRHPHEYPMRSFYIKYLKEFCPEFSEKMLILQKNKTRTLDDPYSLLSAHVHSTSEFASPVLGNLASVIKSDSICDQCLDIQLEVSEYIADVYAAWLWKSWHDFPKEIQDSISNRLSPGNLKEFCA